MMKILLAAVVAATGVDADSGGRVSGSKHDFTASGSTEFRAADESTNRCAFCHGSHGSGERLSSRPDGPERPRTNWGGPAKVRPGEPSAASRMCLSCHDGTLPIGKTRSGDVRVGGFGRLGPGRRAFLGTDLRGSHPISMRSSLGGRTRSPGPGDAVRLEQDGTVQCTSCHDPHAEFGDPTVGKFLVKPSQRSALCLTCHDAGAFQPAGASHGSASASVPGSTSGGSMSDAGCSSCHVSHGAEPESSLVLRTQPGDDDSACLRCHGPGGVGAPVGADVSRPYGHRVGVGVHRSDEGPASSSRRLPETSPGAPRHAACVDCHNPHAATDRPSLAPFAGGAIAGTWGINLAGARVEPIQFEYELCFKCHADSANKPQAAGPLPPETVRRAVVDANLRNVFGNGAASAHPVASPGRNTDLPGLKPPLGAGSTITCSDCHGSDGVGTRGPHGSNFPHILARNYSTAFPTAESPQAYALCYGCHDRDTLLGGGTGFPGHATHVVDRSTPCATCHNAHGVSRFAGDPVRNAHLVDFDVGVVQPGPFGRREFRDLGRRTGSCNLTCHGGAHADRTYGPTP